LRRFHLTRNLFSVGILALILLACNFPRGGTPTVSGPDLVLTYAALTVQARLTLAPTALQLTVTPGTPGGSPTSPGLPLTPPAAATLTPGTPDAICDRGKFEEDVNYPDGSVVEAGIQFTKTWRLRNDGSCPWNPGYAIVFDEGDALNGPASAPLTGQDVPPGETIDVSVNLVAPQEAGSYQGFWMLRNPAGQIFGLGEKADKNFWVKIQVGSTSPIGYDFNIQAKSAAWIGSGGDSGDSNLTFDGADGDSNGVAKLKKDIILENGKLAGVTLVTGPKQVENGKISGTFPEYTVQEDDHFLAKLGFLENCGSGKVIFQFAVKEGDNPQMLGEWAKACDGTLLLPEIDLSSFAGHKVQFVLSVLAAGSPADDLVVWGSARIEKVQ
jgi:hypothetical protein